MRGREEERIGGKEEVGERDEWKFKDGSGKLSSCCIHNTLFSLFELCSVLSGIVPLVNTLINLGSFCLAMIQIIDVVK